MTGIGRISRAELDALPDMNPRDAALTLRAALSRAPAVCGRCGHVAIVVPRCSTTFAGSCPECEGRLELLGP